MFEVKKELLDSHEALLDVVIEAPTVQKAMRSAARQIARQVNIPGFRKGKAPYAMVVRYVGESTVLQEATDNIIEELYPQFIESADIQPYDSGALENMELDPLTLKIRVPLQPTVVLGDYASIRKSFEEITVNDDEVDMVLNQMREENASVKPVNRPSKMGDEVTINITGTVNEEVIVEEKDIKVVFSEKRPFLSQEFSDALLGISIDEERIFTLPLPDEMENEVLRGAETEFAALATQVSERKLPGLDDAFASTVGAFETLDELRQDIHDRIMQSKQQQTQESYRNALIEMLVEPAEVHYPPVLLNETLDQMVKETDGRTNRERQMSLEDALRLEGRTIEQFREELTPQAENRAKTSLVLAEFARVEETSVTDDDVVRGYQELFTNLNLGPSSEFELPTISLDSELARNIRSNLLGSKALERLEQIGRGLADADSMEEAGTDDSEVEDNIVEDSEDVADEAGAEDSVASEDEPLVEAPKTETTQESAADDESSEAESEEAV